MLKGAERRFDNQLEVLSEMRRALIALSGTSFDAATLQQRLLLYEITRVQDAFNNEIDHLYNL